MKRRAFLISSVLAGVGYTMTRSATAAAASDELRKPLERIQRWLRANTPKILHALRPPVARGDLATLERTVGGPLPDALKSLYQWHDGIDSKQTANLFYGLVFPSAHDVADSMQRNSSTTLALKYADPGVDARYILNSTRVPIGNDSEHCFLCVDLAPTEAGRAGQIIMIDEEYRVALKLCESITELVSSFASDLEQGKYSLAEDALADGVQWLSPERSIDPVNWFHSPTWARAHRFAK